MNGVARPDFFGLLHIAVNAARAVNLRGTRDPIDVYIRCAALCARSFRAAGYTWRLITNAPDRVEARIRELGLDGPETLAYEFGWDVPEGISFRSAHYKLELLHAFGQGSFGEHVGLVDIDTVLLRPFSPALLAAPGLVGYDITGTEVRDYGAACIAGAVSAVAGHELPPAWWGGEFLLGRPTDFAMLSAKVATLWPRYVRNWRTLHHQGDEMLTSTAITLLQREGATITDAGASKDVHRWWSARTLSPHAPLAEALASSLLHLPSDKNFLASQGDTGSFAPNAFVAKLRRAAWRKVMARRMMDTVQRVSAAKPRRYAPRIG